MTLNDIFSDSKSQRSLALFDPKTIRAVEAFLTAKVRGVLIYQASIRLQQAVEQTMLAHIAELQKADAEIMQAEQILLRTLGLEGWQPPEPLTYTRRASEAFAARRLDSQFFSPQYEALRDAPERRFKVRELANSAP